MIVNFNSFKSFYVSMNDETFSEKKLYYLRITNIEEKKNIIALFGRVGVRPPLKSTLRPTDNYIKKVICLDYMEKSIAYASNSESSSRT